LTDRLRIAIIGFGVVGRTLCEILPTGDFGMDVVAIADSKSSAVGNSGLDLRKIVRMKQRQGIVGTGKTLSTLKSSRTWRVTW
jgi:glutamate dehydrogenase/leucine dehydrogenase